MGGASKRTVERLFQLETHINLWEMGGSSAIYVGDDRLPPGKDTHLPALAGGLHTLERFHYNVPRALGTTPGRYFHLLHD